MAFSMKRRRCAAVLKRPSPARCSGFRFEGYCAAPAFCCKLRRLLGVPMKRAICAAVLGFGLLGCSSESDDPAGAAGAAGTGGGSNLPTPVIPQSEGACPEFVTGPPEIMGPQ